MDFSLWGFDGLRQAYNAHPAFVHFPIALFPSALLFYFLGIILKRPSLSIAGRGCLYLAVAGTALAIVTGLIAQNSIPHNERIHHMMQTHQQIGFVIGIVSVILVIWSFFTENQTPKIPVVFVLLLMFTSYVVLQNGDLGGRMVYIEGAAVKPAVSIITNRENKELESNVHGHQHGPSIQEEEPHSEPHTH